MESWFKENAPGFSGSLTFGESLSKHSYYRIGGPARVLAQPRGIEDLRWLYRGLTATGAPYFLLGAGSNLLISDSGFDGVVIKCTKLDQSIDAGTPDDLGLVEIKTGGSVAISSLLRRASLEGWSGLELWAGIPGTIGGAVAMNAGTHLGESCQIAQSVEVFSVSHGSERRFERDQLQFKYRGNDFLKTGQVVVRATWKVRKIEPSRVAAVIRETLERRKASQPIDFPSCGSVFKNPRERSMHAWQVIEKVGLRGHRVGGAEFSTKHCNFIVNLGDARASDVKSLIDEAKFRALSQLGITLEEEVRFVGHFEN